MELHYVQTTSVKQGPLVYLTIVDEWLHHFLSKRYKVNAMSPVCPTASCRPMSFVDSLLLEKHFFVSLFFFFCLCSEEIQLA